MQDRAIIRQFQEARRDPDVAVLEGFHAIKHALRFNADIYCVVTCDLPALQSLAADLAADISDMLLQKVKAVDADVFKQLSPLPHPTKVIGLAQRKTATWEVIAKLKGLVVVLDHPARLSNIGASIRVAAAAGAAALIVIGDKDPWSPEAIRGAAGLQYALPILQVASLPQAELPIVAVDPEGKPTPLQELPENALYVFGSERTGITSELLARASHKLRLPMRDQVSSLNLATSVAAVLYLKLHQDKLQ